MTLPSLTTTAPNGPPRPLVTFSVASAMACCMNSGFPCIISFMVHALRSRRVVTPQGERDAVVVIEDGMIRGVHDDAEFDGNMPVEDLGDVALLPGLVDTHVHIN